MANTLITSDFDLTSGDMLNAAVTVFIGWSIQQALSKTNELNRVPLDTVARLCERIETLTGQCLDVSHETLSTDQELLQRLQQLSNEIGWFSSVARSLKVEESEAIVSVFFTFKRQLTGQRRVNLRTASETARELRTTALVVQWQICQQLIDEPTDISVLRTRSSTQEQRTGS